MSKPVYTQKQIQAIISKATELQQNSHSESENGLTLEELEHIAAESGIDPDFIHQAITQLDTAPKEKFSWRNFGGETSIELARELQGTLTDDTWQIIVEEARRHLKKSGGTVQQLGKSREWVVSDQKFLTASLSASPKGNKTKLFVNTSFGKVKFLSYYFPFVLLIMGLGIGLGSADDISTISGMAIGLVSFLTTFSIARFVYGEIVKYQKSKVHRLFDRIKAILDDEEEESLLDRISNESSESITSSSGSRHRQKVD